VNGDDFIELYPDALDRAVCAELIRRFEASGEATRGATGGGVDPAIKDSWDVPLGGRPAWADAESALNRAMLSAVLRYVRKYPYVLLAPMTLRIAAADGSTQLLDAEALRALPDPTLIGLIRKTLRPGAIHLQKYLADRGGYPYWHCELYPKLGDPSGETLHRHLLWTLYLNDEFTEGETEFLYQRRRIKPCTGALLIAPAAFTHTHRGNTPRGADKYIATSWLLFQRAEQVYATR
jgi:hypothetical protein